MRPGDTKLWSRPPPSRRSLPPAPAASGMTRHSAAAIATTPPRPLRPQSAFARLPGLDDPQSALFLPSVCLPVLTPTPLPPHSCGSAVLGRTLVRGLQASLTH